MQPGNTPVVVAAPSPNVVYHPHPGTVHYPKFKPRANLALGIVQVVVGGICILFQIIAIAVYATLSVSGFGIWSGIPFVIAGAFGIVASRRKSRCTVITVMVMSIISAALAGGMVINQSIALAAGPYYYYYYNRGAGVAMNAILFLAALTEMVVAIIQSALCCGATCGSRQPSPATQVMYVNQQVAPQPNMVYPQGMSQHQIQAAPGQQLYIFSQGQYMPVVAMPQGSMAPAMVATPGNQMPPAGAVNYVQQNQVQPQPQTQSYPQPVPANNPQPTSVEASPPPAYAEGHNEEPARTTETGGNWEKF